VSALLGGPAQLDGSRPGFAAFPQPHRPSLATLCLPAATADSTRNSPGMRPKTGRWRREIRDPKGEPGAGALPLYLRLSNDLSESGCDKTVSARGFETVRSAWSSRPDTRHRPEQSPGLTKPASRKDGLSLCWRKRRLHAQIAHHAQCHSQASATMEPGIRLQCPLPFPRRVCARWRGNCPGICHYSLTFETVASPPFAPKCS